MCRFQQLWGAAVVAFGLGLLLGLCLEKGFIWHCCSIILIVIGVGMFRRK